MAKLEFRSPDIKDGGKIPIEFTCDAPNGGTTSPPLQWRFSKSGDGKTDTLKRARELKALKSFVIIVDDPDTIPIIGSIFTHFAVINLPCNLRYLRTGQDFSKIECNGEGPNAIKLLLNDSGEVGWYGPCPPKEDKPHTYRFNIYAINTFLNLPTKTKLTAETFERTFKVNILDQAQFIGTYQRLNNKMICVSCEQNENKGILASIKSLH